MNGQLIAILVLLGIVIAGLAHLFRARRLTDAAFAGAPVRSGTLGVHDVFVTIGLWLLGTMAGVVLAAQLVGDSDVSAAVVVRVGLAQAGASIAVYYVLVRAGLALDRGLHGFGFTFDRIGRSLVVTFATLAFSVAATFVTLAAVTLLIRAAGYEPPKLAHEMLKVLAAAESRADVLAIAASAIIVAPVIEEIIFRGMLQTAMGQRGLGRWPTIIVTSALFAAIHVSPTMWPALPGLFVLAVCLGYAYERTGSIWSPIVIHMVFNAINISLVLGGIVGE